MFERHHLRVSNNFSPALAHTTACPVFELTATLHLLLQSENFALVVSFQTHFAHKFDKLRAFLL